MSDEIFLNLLKLKFFEQSAFSRDPLLRLAFMGNCVLLLRKKNFEDIFICARQKDKFNISFI